ncbi:MAG: MBL fold metallo-hydrolase [bacterium]|nr:MBL fold metallo-hydrolase [bacterium]
MAGPAGPRAEARRGDRQGLGGDFISSTATTAFATQKGILAVDTTGIPVVDRALRGVIARELGRDDFTTLVNTHEHGDHTGGNAVYADCEIVGHELVALPADDLSRSSLREDLALDRPEPRRPVVGRALPRRRPRAPSPTASRSTWGTPRSSRTTTLGGMHTASDIAVFVPRHGILMTGGMMSDRWLTDTPGCLASFVARPGVRTTSRGC